MSGISRGTIKVSKIYVSEADQQLLSSKLSKIIARTIYGKLLIKTSSNKLSEFS